MIKRKIKMQEGYQDFSTLEINQGCCLNCSESHEGCLCYDCKCTKCLWYSPPQENDEIKGSCDYKEVLKERRKEEYKKKLKKQEEERKIKLNILNKQNLEISKKLKQQNKRPYGYLCQKCQYFFISEEELKVIQYKTPICPICSNKIKVSQNG